MIQFSLLKKHNIIHGITDSSFGSAKKKSRATKFLKKLIRKINKRKVVWAEQVFGRQVHLCRRQDDNKIIKKVDGLLTNLPDQILAVVSADCVPILLFDPHQQVVGVLHGARQSLVKGLVGQAIKQMITNFHSKPKDILVGLGPHIRKCHYWLEEETEKKLAKTKFKKYFLIQKDKIYFDLTKLVLDELKKTGIKNKNIEDCGVCTFCQYKKYFSNRKIRENPHIYLEKNPRFASFIGLKAPRLIKINQILIDEVIDLLKQGEVIVIPTDTVYGLIADATNQKAVARIFQIKKRPLNKPLPIFVSDLKMAKQLARINQQQEKILKQVWPGRVTVVLERQKEQKIYGVDKKTIGLRLPNYPLIKRLLRQLKRPLIGTSANLSGQSASTKIKEILKQFNQQKHQPSLIIDAGNLKANRPSMVIDLINPAEIKILRK